MDINQQKEQFSYAYIYAVAATAGYSFQVAARPLDFDGIDIILVVVPDETGNWLVQSQQELCLRYCGYWVSLRGQPPTENQVTITVSMPRQNVFDVEALRNLMQRIGAGEPL